MEDSDEAAEDVSVRADPPKTAPSRQTQASKQKRKKKKGKADLSDKSSQAEPAKGEEDLDQLLTELNIKLVCPIAVADHAFFSAAKSSSTSEGVSMHALILSCVLCAVGVHAIHCLISSMIFEYPRADLWAARALN